MTHASLTFDYRIHTIIELINFRNSEDAGVIVIESMTKSITKEYIHM